jgi:phytanoyl-CoA hydroxylase
MNEFNINYHISNLHNNGYTIIRNGFSSALADKIIIDFDKWLENSDNFLLNQKKRITNFHVLSDNTLELATNNYVNSVISTFFDSEQVIYSSLFFREGTEQHLHRDTPHFYTNPINKYCGVWFALEDINQNAGPLRYYKKSHLIDDLDNHKIYRETFDETKSYSENNLNSLLKYNKIIEEKCEKNNLELIDENNYEKIFKGDIIIWHPKLLHGGSKVIDHTLTRYSMVTHNIPVDTQVFNSSHFFTEEPTNNYTKNINTFKYLIYNNIKYVNHCCSPKVQTTYI